MDSDDISDPVDDGQIFESLGEENKGGKVAVVSGSLLVLDVETLVDDLEGADVSAVTGLVGEGGVDDNGVEVLGFSSNEGCFGELNVLVLLNNQGWEIILWSRLLSSWGRHPWMGWPFSFQLLGVSLKQ